MRRARVLVILSALIAGSAALSVAPSSLVWAGASCKGPPGVTNVRYVLTTPAGKTTTVTKLRGNVKRGDTVEAVFTVPAACAPEQLSLASYESILPPSDPAFLRDNQLLFSSASGTFSAGQHTLTAKVVPAPKPAGTLTITGSMEGNLPVHPGDTLKAGYDFTIPGQHPAATVRVSNARVTLTVDCPGGSTVPVTIPLPAQPVFPSPARSSRGYVRAQITSVTAGHWTIAAMLPLIRPGPSTSV